MCNFYRVFSYLQLCQPFSSVKFCYLCNYVKVYYDKPFCEIILNLDRWLGRRCHLKIFLFLHLVAIYWTERAVCANVVAGIIGNIYVKLL